jgi:hypothetical protein
MKLLCCHLFFIILFLAGYEKSNAQFFSKKRLSSSREYKPKPIRYSSLSFGVGTSHYYGDVGPETFVKATTSSIRWNMFLSYAYTLTPKFHIGADLAFIRIAGDDFNADNDNNFIRNLHFRNDILQTSLFGQYHPFAYATNFSKRVDISPYLTIGMGYMFHNPKAKLPMDSGNNDWVALEPLHTEGQGINAIYPNPYKLSGFTVPIGLGVRYKYKNKIDFAFEIAYQTTFTDYLDDVSGIYPNPLLLESNEAKILSNRSREQFAAASNGDRSDRIIAYLKANGLPDSKPFESSAFVFGAVGTDRGSKTGNDSYLTSTFKIILILPESTIRCPKIY